MNTRTRQRDPVSLAAQVPVLLPARIIEIELGQPLPVLLAFDARTSRYYQRALCVVRLHTQPLGIVEFQFDKVEISGHEYCGLVWDKLSTKINGHLRQDGFVPIKELDAAGLPGSGTPWCIEERDQFKENAPYVSVIVPTHNRPDRLQGCLRSLLALQYPRYEIIIVDNAPSTSATREYIEQTCHKMQQVRYVREDRPGVSWARNCGMMIAQGEILAFTDDDVVVDPYWLIELVQGFSRAGEVACVTGYNLPLELETPAQFWYEEYGGAYWFQKNGGTTWGFTRLIFDLKEYRPKTTALFPYRAGMFGCGASMAFTAAFLRSVNGFDPALGGNGPARCSQDIAVFFQVITRGYTLVYEPASLVYHLHRRTYSELRKQIYNYGVGLTAYLTKSFLDNPRLLFDFIAQLAYAPFLLLRTHSPHRRKSALYPKELIRVKRKGMMYGPLAYVRSRRMMQKVSRVIAPSDT
jgi:glycosyltransferase involved in cell wall biosynthesis